MSIKDYGKIGVSGVIKGTVNLPEKMNKFILSKMDNDKSYNISIGHSNASVDGEKMKALIQKGHSRINAIHLMDIGCAMGVHTGPGSIAVAIQPA